MNHSSPSQPPPAAAQVPADDPSASSLFEWYDFLDFNIEESTSIPFPQPEQGPTQLQQEGEDPRRESPGRVRKRDPRLACSNFLSGRIPCACPELDAKLEEGEEDPSKKRTRTARVTDGAPARCQVPGCEADISELKGYHRRHRVCLRCASAGSVVLDGENKRYCQQCGRFHVLSDFDEGKRSCRRKLEKHNSRRRRRKQNESKESAGNETKQIVVAGDASGDDDNGKDGLSTISQTEERGASLDSDVHFSTLGSALGSHGIQTDSIVSNAITTVAHANEDHQNPESKYSPSYLDNKSNFSSACPTGRISFKLYDWNPAEFPRSLRHQIFQWLASMPVELEGYIRPGCTILTAFIAMPGLSWQKLLEEPTLHINDLVAKPRSMLFGRGTLFVYLNDMTFHVTKDATSVVKIKVGDQAPKLHYIHPNCFEAGKPMEFVACGSHLLQPDFRFLISFAGQYLVYNISVLSACYENGDANRTDHQLLKIFVPEINRNIMGPAFIEVENQSGISNFIPILVGDVETCSEMGVLQRRFNMYVSSQEQMPSPSHTKCEEFAFRQAQMLEFILDTAWLLKKPISEQQLTSIHIQRLNHFLKFLIENKSCFILKSVLCCLNYYMDKDLVAGLSDSERKLLRMSMDVAQSRLAQNLLDEDASLMHAGDGALKRESCQGSILSVVPATSQKIAKNIPILDMASISPDEEAIDPLLKGDVIMMVNPQGGPGKIRSTTLTRPFFISRPLRMAIAAIGVCLGICAISLQPQRVTRITTRIHVCMLSNS